MKLNKHDAQTDMEMDMTSMIDVVFLLIIFFMIITDLTQQELEDLQLPVAVKAVQDKPDKEAVRPILNVMFDGTIVVKKEKKYDPEHDDGYKEVAAYLSDHAQKMRDKGRVEHLDKEKGTGPLIPDDPLLIRADQVTAFSHIQEIMARCGLQDVQIWKVELAAAEDEDAKKAREAAQD